MPADSVMPDIPRLYTAISEWIACIMVVTFAGKRFNKIQTGALCVASFIVIVCFHYIAETLPMGFWVPCMICAVASMCLFIWAACKYDVKAACFMGVQAFTVAEFIAAVEWWLYYFFSTLVPEFKNVYVSAVFMAVIYAALFTAIFFLERFFSRKKAVKVSLKDLLAAVVIVITTFLISNISFMGWNTPLSSKYAMEIFYIRTLVDLCGVLVLYTSREIKIANGAETELAHIQFLLDKQYEQYCMTKETIDAVNRRYHDLKHQVALLKERGSEGAEKLGAEIEKETRLYDVVYKTDNDVLDTILTTKSAMCVQKGISFTCVADGAALHFIGDADLCSIFGNALDNAIECCVEEGKDGNEAQLIKLAVYKNNGLIIIKCENSFTGVLKISNGELLTTKKEKANHGYGVKSIKTVVAKYGGTVSYKTEDGTFTLCIVIPVQTRH